MADNDFISIEVDEDHILQKFDFFFEYHREYVHGLLGNVANFGVFRLHAGVPQFSTYLLRHVDRSAIKWMPGGPGGAGEWGVIVGIKAGSSKHPLYAEFGTGLYATPSRGYITGNNKEYMSFPGGIYGKWIRTKQVKGQKPQRYFYSAWQDVKVYALARLVAGNATPFR